MARHAIAPGTASKKQDTSPADASSAAITNIDDGKTPTRASLGQKPLPTEPSPTSLQPSPARPTTNSSSDADRSRLRDSSRHSKRSPTQRSVDDDVDMDDQSDPELEGEGADRGDDNGVSEDDSGNDDDSKSGKKKKSQRFYCTDYPPCNLSFTRSEHLARHIRKHTGERPFQCHCSRRFSRLDNLRQHAQTVHVNEDIPIDSLAATGSRFQRQIRTDRVRQAAGNRARASTGGSAGGPIRGHSKSLSTSSINSVSSVGSNYSIATDARRRPPPLVMATGGVPQDPRARSSLESYRSGGDSIFSGYRPPSPGDFTPTSATFSIGQSSPRWSGVASPASSHSRTQSMYTIGEGRVPNRRLSVPSGTNPFQTQLGHRMTFPQGQTPTSNADVFAYGDTSPSAASSNWSRRDSVSSATDSDWRRKTWHPDNRNYNGNTGQLSAAVSQPEAPNPPPPVVGPPHQPQSSSNLRLPGIESLIHGPSTPPQRITSPMAVDSEPPPSVPRRPLIDSQDDRRNNLNMYDANMQRRFDYRLNTPPRDSPSAWASEVHQSLQQASADTYRSPPSVRFEEQPPPPQQKYLVNGGPPGRSLHQQTMSAPSMATIREKRHGWYQGPVPARGPPPRGQPPAQVHQQQDPRSTRVEKMVHPNFNGFAGFPARQETPRHGGQDGGQGTEPERRLGGLDALVAAATGEGSTAKAY